MEDLDTAEKESNGLASQHLPSRQNATTQQHEPQITALLQTMHMEQLKLLEARYAKLEERIVRVVQYTVDRTRRPSGKDLSSSNSATSYNAKSHQNKCSSQHKAGAPLATSVSHFDAATSKVGLQPSVPSQCGLLPTPAEFDEKTGFYRRSTKKQQAIYEAKDDDDPDVAHTPRKLFGSNEQWDSEKARDSLKARMKKKGTQANAMLHKITDFENRTKKVDKNVHRISQDITGSSYSSIGRVAYFRALMTQVLRSKWTETTVLLVILANTIYMAWHTNWIAETLEEPTDAVNRGIGLFFTIFFCLDIGLRLYVEQDKFISGANWRWNILDSIVVITAIMEEVLLIMQSQASAISSTKVVRIIRVLRLIRLIRFIRGAAFFTELRALCLGIFQTVGSLFWAIVLLTINIFIFAIYLTQGVAYYLMEQVEEGADENAIKDHDLRVSFGSLPMTMYSLWKALTGGADWEAYCDPLFEISPMMGVIFVLFIAFAICALFNVVTGIFVNKALKVAEGDMDLVLLAHNQDRKEHMEAVKRVFATADVNKNGFLTRTEFAKHFDDPCVQAFFNGLDLDLDRIDPEQLFNMMDVNGDNNITENEFVYACSTMKGAARNLDVVRLAWSVQKHAAEQLELITRVEAVQKQQAKDLKKVTNTLEEASLSIPAADCSHFCPVEFNQIENGADRTLNPIENGASDVKNMCAFLSMQEGLECRESVTTTDTPSVVRFQVFFGEGIKSLGFSIEWRVPTPVVGNVEQNGEAEAHGICTGDLIEEVNDCRTEGLFREDLLPHFQTRPLTLSFCRTVQEEDSIPIEIR